MSDLDFPAPGNLPPEDPREDPQAAADREADIGPETTSEAEPEEWYSEDEDDGDEDDMVADASIDSFPASDPPSYTLHRS